MKTSLRALAQVSGQLFDIDDHAAVCRDEACPLVIADALVRELDRRGFTNEQLADVLLTIAMENLARLASPAQQAQFAEYMVKVAEKLVSTVTEGLLSKPKESVQAVQPQKEK